jgi:hypothetical protein
VALGHAAQPGDLALGQLARGGNAFFAHQVHVQRGLVAALLPVQFFPGLAVAHAAHAGQVQVQIAAGAQVRTSSTKPCSSICSKRWAMRWCSQARSVGSSENSVASKRGADASFAVWKLDSGLPETCHTSSARWMRWLSPGARRRR